MYGYYRRTLSRLFASNPRLRRIFRASLYPALSCNFGPATATVPHVDSGNYAGGLCVIQSAGNFDPTKGGHIFFRQLHLVVEFPPGATILVPSGVIEHGNTPVTADETRVSITQYAAGGLFRWVEYGERSVKTVEKTDPTFAERMRAQDSARWDQALDRFSRADELHRDRMNVFWGTKAEGA